MVNALVNGGVIDEKLIKRAGEWRNEFPILEQRVHDRPLTYLDNAASTQKPRVVGEALQHVYHTHYANIHRGIHELSQVSTDAFEMARRQIARFIGARDTAEIICTRNATEAINLVAQSWGRAFLEAGDQVLLTEMEHHANLIPWQMLAREKGIQLRFIPLNPNGELDLSRLDDLMGPKVKLLGFCHVSNALGTVNPLPLLVQKAREKGIKVLVDAAQSVHHLGVNVAQMDLDFMVFSGHKTYGPSGTGVLWARKEILESMPPWQGGGEMIQTVTLTESTWADLPWKFEAGTPFIEGFIALGKALEWLTQLGLDQVREYESSLLSYMMTRIREVKTLRLIGEPEHRNSVVSFILGKHHPQDIGLILDQMGIAVRTGHHCAWPVMQYFKVPGTCRASLALYNNTQDVDRLIEGLGKCQHLLDRS